MEEGISTERYQLNLRQLECIVTNIMMTCRFKPGLQKVAHTKTGGSASGQWWLVAGGLVGGLRMFAMPPTLQVRQADANSAKLSHRQELFQIIGHQKWLR